MALPAPWTALDAAGRGTTSSAWTAPAHHLVIDGIGGIDPLGGIGYREAMVANVTGWLDRPGGPLPQAQVQVELSSIELGAVVEWQMLNRGGLSVLIHPETGNDLLDHTDRAVWLGTPLDLRLDRL